MSNDIAGRPERLVLEGTPRERGRKHGEVYAGEIAENVETYLEVFAHYGADEGSVFADVEEFVGIIESENPGYAEEMEAVAEGADLDIEAVAMLNARYEVMYSVYAETAAELSEDPYPSGGARPRPDGCTAFGAQPEITRNGHTIVGQNWDWIPGVNTFIVDLRREEGTNQVAMTEAGIVGGKIGLNDRGIGMLLNGLVSEFETIVPHTLCRAPRLKRLLSKHRGEIDVDVAKSALRDHFGKPASICSHADPGRPNPNGGGRTEATSWTSPRGDC